MKKIMLCGGGSAGHVMPNIAIYENLKNQFDFVYVGTPAIERDICNAFDIPFRTFDGVKLVRGKLFCNLSLPLKLLNSVAQCKQIIAEESPDLLFCKGGYASYPPAVTAHKLNIPVLTHESDITAGLANKLIAHKAEKVLTSFPTTARQFKNGIYTGSPIRASLFNRNKLEAKRQLDLDMRPTILFLGGGSGSQKINECLRGTVIELCKKYNVLHVCGKGNKVENNLYGYKQFEFCNDMGLIYAAADYAVSRCGSNCACELISLKIPTLFIPLSNGRSRGDQIENARYFNRAGLCRVLNEDALDEKSLTQAIDMLINDDKLKAALEMNTLACGNRNIEIEIKKLIKN